MKSNLLTMTKNTAREIVNGIKYKTTGIVRLLLKYTVHRMLGIIFNGIG